MLSLEEAGRRVLLILGRAGRMAAVEIPEEHRNAFHEPAWSQDWNNTIDKRARRSHADNHMKEDTVFTIAVLWMALRVLVRSRHRCVMCVNLLMLTLDMEHSTNAVSLLPLDIAWLADLLVCTSRHLRFATILE